MGNVNSGTKITINIKGSGVQTLGRLTNEKNSEGEYVTLWGMFPSKYLWDDTTGLLYKTTGWGKPVEIVGKGEIAAPEIKTPAIPYLAPGAVVIDSYMDDCDGTKRDCCTDAVTVYRNPDGTTFTRRLHAH